MKKMVFLSLLLVVLLSATPVFASGLPSTDALLSWNKFKNSNSDAEVSWNKETGRLNSIIMDFPEVPIRAQNLDLNDAENIAREFISNNEDMFSVKDLNSHIKLSNFSRTGKTCHLNFDQMFKGIKVESAGLKIHIKGNKITMITSTINPEAIAEPAPSKRKPVTAEAARSIALAELSPKALRGDITLDVAFSTKSGSNCLAHIVRIPSAEPLGDFEYLINSDNGDILTVTNYMDNTVEKGKITGRAFLTNPEQCKVTTLPIENLTDKTKLVGKFVKVYNDDDNANEAVETDGTFHYEVGNTHFEEVMAYYHLNKVHDFFKNNYNFSKLDYSFPIHVHYGDNYDNAFYSPWQGIIALGDGNKLNNLAREAGVIYHEYTHVVTGKIASLRGGEAGAMNEAFSDYFACTMTDDPMIGEWVMKKLNRPFMRNCDNNSHYPEDVQNEVHRDSPMYSGPLWKIREKLGAKIADKIIHFSRYYLQSGAKFTDGLKATIAADKEHYNGSHEDVITECFAKHGIESKEPQTIEDFKNLLKFRSLNNDEAAAEFMRTLEAIE